MRIAIVSSIYNYSDGGAVGVCADQALGLKNRDHDIFVFSGSLLGDEVGWSKECKIEVCKTQVKNYRYLIRSYSCVFNLRIQKEFEDFLEKTKPDIIHFHNLYPYLPFSLIKIASRQVSKVFFTAHDVMSFSQHKLTHFIDSSHTLNNIDRINYHLSLYQQIKQDKKAYNPFRNFFIRQYLSQATKIFSVSSELKKALEQNSIKNVTTVHNGINSFIWSADLRHVELLRRKLSLLDKKIIFCAGRINQAKGSKQLEQAMLDIIKKIPKAILLIADSQGQSKIRLPKKNLISIGSIPRQEMKNYYSLADIVVVPSMCFDSFPTINLEALACAKAVVSTIYGGSREVVKDKKTGFIVNPANVREMTDKIIYLLEHPEKAENMGKNGRQLVENKFGFDAWIDKILSFY